MASEGKIYYELVKLFPTGGDEFDTTVIKPDESNALNCVLFGQKNLSDISTFLTPCKQLVAYINVIESKCAKLNVAQRCIYLNYCINGIFRETKNEKISESQFITAYKDLLSQFNGCSNNIEYIKNDVFTKVQDLYNIYSLHNKLMNMDSSTQNDCKGYNELVETYMKYKIPCEGKTDNDFCNALEIFKIYYGLYAGTILGKCKDTDIDIDLPSFQSFHVHDSAESEVDLNGDFSGHLDNSAYRLLYTTIFFPFSVILVIFSILFILYKFTPFGSWLRLRIKNEKRIWKKFYEKKQQLFDDTVHEQLNSEKNQFSIRYHS
ncbi:PIR Superfamily Protein [Plasmodium ovale wallikeri]|uniref:PIR Superfamily Protein n=1 Tax=Plasmodium ovale wallikeri TaxID=864142 RepID=A0A1A9AI34_PLAOA|nr:PIR Superfamily Protein [Plasmodium ovale wallikeri]